MSKTQELVGVSRVTRVLTSAKNRNSWANRSIRILGNVVELDEWLDRRMKCGQRVTAVSSILGVPCYLLNNIFFRGHNLPLNVGAAVSAVGVSVGFGILYFKNISLAITRRLLKEVNVVIILVLGICIFIIDCVAPYDSFAPINGFIYFIMVSLFLFLDAVKKKSRPFVLAVGILFVVTTLWNIYTLTFTGSSVGIILFQYGDDYVLRKRPFKRSCFLQILLFSLNGVWTMFIDKKMDTMMFATGHVYRETGTASKYVEDRQYSTQWRSESG